MAEKKVKKEEKKGRHSLSGYSTFTESSRTVRS